MSFTGRGRTAEKDGGLRSCGLEGGSLKRNDG